MSIARRAATRAQLLPFPLPGRRRTACARVWAPLLASACATLGGCGRDPSGTVAGPPAAAPAPAVLTVARGSGVVGTPDSGASSGPAGRSVAYRFEAAPGFEAPTVYLDTLPVPASGTVVLDHDHVLVATALRAPGEAAASPESRDATTLYTSTSPGAAVPAYLRLVRAALAADAAGDSAASARVRLAEYAVLRAAGPDGLTVAATSLAGQTVVLAGASPGEANVVRLGTADAGRLLDAARRSAAGTAPLRDAGSVAPPVLFSADSVAPTTYVYVNGILNFTAGDATTTAVKLFRTLGLVGWTGQQTAPDPSAPRPNAAVRMLVHWNPVVDVQGPLSCLRSVVWAVQVAQLGDAHGSPLAALAQAGALLSGLVSRGAVGTDCGWTVSTNARVLEQLLAAGGGGFALPDARDAALVGLIDRERASAGGRDVLVVGHSQGSAIARTAIALARPGAVGLGCLGALALGSPLSSSLSWPGADRVDRLIARGTASGSYDFFYPWGGMTRTDGLPSGRTAAFDAYLGARPWAFWPVLEQVRLHTMTSYLAPDDGLRVEIGTRMRDGYAGLAGACAGQLTGVVSDLATGFAISGATVQTVRAGTPRGAAVQSRADGTFTTPTLLPVLHDLIVTAPGYDTVRLTQRLVPFRTSAPAQDGPILLGKRCDPAPGCRLSGTYAVTYNLSGSVVGVPVSCAFQSRVVVTQSDSVFIGTITTAAYQRGCDAPDRFGYIEWRAGSTSITAGRIAADGTIRFTHGAVPPWQMTGRAFANGFVGTEARWQPGSGYALRVEIAATRTGPVPNAAVLAARPAARDASEQAALSAGPRLVRP